MFAVLSSDYMFSAENVLENVLRCQLLSWQGLRMGKVAASRCF